MLKRRFEVHAKVQGFVLVVENHYGITVRVCLYERWRGGGAYFPFLNYGSYKVKLRYMLCIA